MKIECNIINDLLPLYKDDLLSNETKDVVENHLKTCEKCNKNLINYKNEIFVNNKKNKTFFPLFLIHYVLVFGLAIIVQILGVTYFNKNIFFTNYTLIQSLALSLYLLMPFFSFIGSVLITKKHSIIKIILLLCFLFFINQLLASIFFYAFSSNAISYFIKNYISFLSKYALYSLVPILVGFVFESIYKVFKKLTLLKI